MHLIKMIDHFEYHGTDGDINERDKLKPTFHCPLGRCDLCLSPGARSNGDGSGLAAQRLILAIMPFYIDIFRASTGFASFNVDQPRGT
jgi:hypothetical protein